MFAERNYLLWDEPSDDGVIGDCLDCGQGVVCEEFHEGLSILRCTFCDGGIRWLDARREK